MSERAMWSAIGSAVILVFGVAEPAYGYTDPGSGLLLWQMVGAAFVGSLFYVKRLVGWLRFGRRKERDAER